MRLYKMHENEEHFLKKLLVSYSHINNPCLQIICQYLLKIQFCYLDTAISIYFGWYKFSQKGTEVPVCESVFVKNEFEIIRENKALKFISYLIRVLIFANLIICGIYFCD